MKLQKINNLVAEKVMNWKLEKLAFSDYWVGEQDGWFLKQLWKPTTNIEDAWLVVEKLENSYLQVHIATLNMNEGYSVQIYKPEQNGLNIIKYADSAPLAICLAALKSVGVEVEVDG